MNAYLQLLWKAGPTALMQHEELRGGVVLHSYFTSKIFNVVLMPT